MGQYHYIANYDKKEYLHPHKFNDGLKLMEFGGSGRATMLGLAVLLAASCKGGARGGGDIAAWPEDKPRYDNRVVKGLTEERGQWLMDNMVGRWAGDRIAIIGDYADDSDANGLVGNEGTPWINGRVDQGDDFPNPKAWTDISTLTVEAIEMDYYTWADRQKVEA